MREKIRAAQSMADFFGSNVRDAQSDLSKERYLSSEQVKRARSQLAMEGPMYEKELSDLQRYSACAQYAGVRASGLTEDAALEGLGF